MRKKTDESPKAPRSDRLRGWWFRGVEAEPPPPRAEMSDAVKTHLDGMAGHALRIERAAITDGARIRKEALAAASAIVEHVEHLESQLALVENQFGRVIDTMRTELADLRAKLAEEAQHTDAAGTPARPVLGPVSGPAPVSGNGNGNGNGYPAPHVLQAG